ncbi:retroviral-like aspartic protease family protein [Argonema antarcticum]|uniref:retroviral-like aspartic protease family protein n=1 Tax=Argonema antarcticum TaxID=2942763 RepID=UPI002013B9C1|nr:retroviral-like aspartic protease family protein [Argonema antarcticum]MCL1473685.1 retroviral-like aspartic protease family protein [Argonema antarcticum A004/B2]
MTLLFFANEETFACGATGYEYRPVTQTENTNRIILEVEIQGIPTIAVVDTGAPYVICAPKVALEAGVARASALETRTMLIRGMRLDGFIVRLNIRLVAREGENLDVDSTVFVPEVEEYWGDFPSFIGLTGFLERMRFAIDPSTDTFYFGQL